MEWIQKASSYLDTIDQRTAKSIIHKSDHEQAGSKDSDHDHEDDDEEEEIEEEEQEEEEDDVEDDNDDEAEEIEDEEQPQAAAPSAPLHDDGNDTVHIEEDSNTEHAQSLQSIDTAPSEHAPDQSSETKPDADSTEADRQKETDSALRTQPKVDSALSIDTQSKTTSYDAPLLSTPASTTSNSNKSKPKKQSKSKSKRSKSKQNKQASSSSSHNGGNHRSNHSDYVQLKKQYEGMVKLWNEERANLKKAQQLLRNQKDSFKLQQQDMDNEHAAKLDELRREYEQQLKSKSASIESLEASLLKVKEERNTTIEDGDEMKMKLSELEQEKREILQEKSQVLLEKQQQIESIRKEFELERKGWEKEREILTKNIERETILESENVEYTNALARTQSNLQQKELENARLKGELKWLKQDKEDLQQSNEILREQNESAQQQVDTLQGIVHDKSKEMMQVKSELNERLNEESVKYKQLSIEHEKLKQEVNRNESHLLQRNSQVNDRQSELEKRIKELTNSLLEKQTELDMCISKKNEFRLRLSKLEESMQAMNQSSLMKKEDDLESGLLKSRVGRAGKSGSELAAAWVAEKEELYVV
eukprot:CAMPEP_0197035258 /NCGR_PEP_ID=MMETSP1384-20130603/13113_1 /TAXON_ID=29189 /ORGANISM="Ammonia sp." /LENGTH=590 /DNA_ID=CAMNT_0042465301 /DNA_START=21 /DNA_END=1792 /DNA_ORIENTATION=+